MRPWNPHGQAFHGEPIVGQTPVRLVVHGSPLTPLQAAWAQAAHARFCMQARLSKVPNPTEIGALPDGSPYRIVVVGNTTTMELRAGGAQGAPGEPALMANGILRDRGRSYPPDPPGYRELKSVGGTSYEITQKFTYRASPDIEYGPNIYKWFMPDATGLMRKYAQFLAGANAWYCAYLYRQDVLPAATDLGTGIVAFGSGTSKRVYFYSYADGVVRAVKADVVPAKTIVKDGRVPAEILNIFGGCPIPPSEQQWATRGYNILHRGDFSAALGWDIDGLSYGYTSSYFGASAGTSFGLPAPAVSDDGKKLYAVARGAVNEADEYRRVRSRPFAVSFSEVESAGVYSLAATVQATHYDGVVNYQPKGDKGYIEGTTKGICAVGLFNSQPTYFEIEALAADNGYEGVEPVEIKVNISGGINKSGVVYSRHRLGEPVATGSFSVSLTYIKTGTFDRRRNVSGYIYGPVGEIWSKEWTASATFRQEFIATDRMVVIGGDGAIEISEPSLQQFVQQDINVSASSSSPQGEYTLYEYNGPYPRTDYGPFPGVSESATGEIVQSGPKWFEKLEWVLSKAAGDGVLGGLSPGHAGAYDEEIRKLAFIEGLLPGYTSPPVSAAGWHRTNEPQIEPGGAIIHAGDSSYSVNTMAILTSFTTDKQLADIKNSDALLSINPVYCVPPKSLPPDVVRPEIEFYAFSHLGTPQIIRRYGAWNYRKGGRDATETNRGALVAGDTDYEHRAQAYFVGKT